ncbi:MAG: hypothetical protein WCZ98_03885 [Sideroxydans sp.]
MRRTVVASVSAIVAIFLTLCATPLAAQPAQCQPNPVFTLFAGEEVERCESMRYNELTLMRWTSADNPNAGNQTVTVEGEYWYYFNNLRSDAAGRLASKLEVQRNIQNAVKAAKGTVLYADAGKTSYRIAINGADYWGESGCGRGGAVDCTAILHKIVKVTALEQMVSVVGVQTDAAPAFITPVLPAPRKPLVAPPLRNVTQLHSRLQGKKIRLGEGLSFDLHRFVSETSLINQKGYKHIFEPSFQQRYLNSPVSYTEEVKEMDDRVVVTRTMILDIKNPCDPGLESEGIAFCFKPSGEELNCNEGAPTMPAGAFAGKIKNDYGTLMGRKPQNTPARQQAACEAKASLAKVRDKVRARLAASPNDPEARRVAPYLQMSDTQLMDHLLNKESSRKKITLTSVVPYLAYEFRKAPEVDIFDLERPLPRVNLFKLPPPSAMTNSNLDRFRAGVPRNAEGRAMLPAGMLAPTITSISPASGMHGDSITVQGTRMDSVIEPSLIDGAERYPQAILNRSPTHITMSNIAPAGNKIVSLAWNGGETTAEQPYTITFPPLAYVPPAPGPYRFENTRDIEAKFLTGFTWARRFGNNYEVEFADETWATDRYYAKFRYLFTAGFGMRWPFRVTANSVIDRVYSGDNNTVVQWPADQICKGSFQTEGAEATRNAHLCAQRATVSLKAEPVDGDAAFYRDTGLPDEKIFEGKEFVLELGLTCRLYASIPGPNIGVNCPGGLSGFDLGQHYSPQLGTTNADFMEEYWPGRSLGLAIDLGLGYAAFNPGVIVQGDNGTLTLDLVGLSSTPSQASVDLKTAEKRVTVTENNARGAWGLGIANPRYSVDLSLKPAVEVELGLDLIAFSWVRTFPPISIDAIAIDIGRADFEHHEATNGTYRLRDIGIRPGTPPAIR